MFLALILTLCPFVCSRNINEVLYTSPTGIDEGDCTLLYPCSLDFALQTIGIHNASSLHLKFLPGNYTVKPVRYKTVTEDLLLEGLAQVWVLCSSDSFLEFHNTHFSLLWIQFVDCSFVVNGSSVELSFSTFLGPEGFLDVNFQNLAVSDVRAQSGQVNFEGNETLQISGSDFESIKWGRSVECNEVFFTNTSFKNIVLAEGNRKAFVFSPTMITLDNIFLSGDFIAPQFESRQIFASNGGISVADSLFQDIQLDGSLLQANYLVFLSNVTIIAVNTPRDKRPSFFCYYVEGGVLNLTDVHITDGEPWGVIFGREGHHFLRNITIQNMSIEPALGTPPNVIHSYGNLTMNGMQFCNITTRSSLIYCSQSFEGSNITLDSVTADPYIFFLSDNSTLSGMSAINCRSDTFYRINEVLVLTNANISNCTLNIRAGSLFSGSVLIGEGLIISNTFWPFWGVRASSVLLRDTVLSQESTSFNTRNFIQADTVELYNVTLRDISISANIFVESVRSLFISDLLVINLSVLESLFTSAEINITNSVITDTQVFNSLFNAENLYASNVTITRAWSTIFPKSFYFNGTVVELHKITINEGDSSYVVQSYGHLFVDQLHIFGFLGNSFEDDHVLLEVKGTAQIQNCWLESVITNTIFYFSAAESPLLHNISVKNSSTGFITLSEGGFNITDLSLLSSTCTAYCVQANFVNLTDCSFSDSVGTFVLTDTLLLSSVTLFNHTANIMSQFYSSALVNLFNATQCTGSIFSVQPLGRKTLSALGPALTISNSFFSRNTAIRGTIVWSAWGTMEITITDSQFWDNYATSRGCILYAEVFPTLSVSGNTYVGNGDLCGDSLFTDAALEFVIESPNQFSVPLERDISLELRLLDSFNSTVCQDAFSLVDVNVSAVPYLYVLLEEGVMPFDISWRTLRKFPSQDYNVVASWNSIVTPLVFRTAPDCGKYVAEVLPSGEVVCYQPDVCAVSDGGNYPCGGVFLAICAWNNSFNRDCYCPNGTIPENGAEPKYNIPPTENPFHGSCKDIDGCLLWVSKCLNETDVASNCSNAGCANVPETVCTDTGGNSRSCSCRMGTEGLGMWGIPDDENNYNGQCDDVDACLLWQYHPNCTFANSSTYCSCGNVMFSRCNDSGINKRECSCLPGYHGFNTTVGNENFFLTDDQNPFLGTCVENESCQLRGKQARENCAMIAHTICQKTGVNERRCTCIEGLQPQGGWQELFFTDEQGNELKPNFTCACPPQRYFDGDSCVECTGCGAGQRLIANCSTDLYTQCKNCPDHAILDEETQNCICTFFYVSNGNGDGDEVQCEENYKIIIPFIVIPVCILLFILACLGIWLRNQWLLKARLRDLQLLPKEITGYYTEAASGKPGLGWVEHRGELASLKEGFNYLYYEKRLIGSAKTEFIEFFKSIYGDGDTIAEYIGDVIAVYSPNNCSIFSSTYNNLVKSSANTPASSEQYWPHEEQKDVVAHLDKRKEIFKWNLHATVPILLVAHGTSLHYAKKICNNGFASLAFVDDGWYGRGLYFTSMPYYALKYVKGQPVIILSYVIPGNVYPTIEQPRRKFFKGKPLMPGYQSHYVPVNSRGYPHWTTPEARRYDEFAISEESQVCPAYIICLQDDVIQFKPDIPVPADPSDSEEDEYIQKKTRKYQKDTKHNLQGWRTRSFNSSDSETDTENNSKPTKHSEGSGLLSAQKKTYDTV